MTESPFIRDVTRDNFAELMEVSSRVPVVLDFWASWCQPCQVLMPILARLADEYQGRFLLGKLNTESEQEIAAEFGIRSIPTVKLFRDGQPVDEFMGALPEHAVREFLDRHIARESDEAIPKARERLLAGDTDGAISILGAAREADPDNPRIGLRIAEAQAAAGDAAGAEATLDSLPSGGRDDPGVAALRSQLFFITEAAETPGIDALEKQLETDPEDPAALYQLAMRKAAGQRYEEAMELLLKLMRLDRQYGDDAGRKGLVRLFEMLGDDPLVGRFRGRMASLLF